MTGWFWLVALCVIGAVICIAIIIICVSIIMRRKHGPYEFMDGDYE